MADVKIAVLGAGSFVFGPSLLNDAIVERRLGTAEIALMDPNRQAVELMAGVGRRMARDTGVATTVTAHTDRAAALAGADFVVCSAARELWPRFATDCAVIARHYPGHLVTEFGGVAGISSSLRQIALIREICADVHRLCPGAWLLNVANPLPRVAQAAHEEGVRTIGFCSASLSGYGFLWQLLGHARAQIRFPFEPAISRLAVTMGGTNHLSWLTALSDAATGEDLYPEVRRRVTEGATAGNPLSERLLRETGYLLMPGDAHVRDFFAPTGEAPDRAEPSHGTPAERQARLDLMRAVGAGEAPWDPLLAHRSWERPADVIAALVAGTPARFTSLNLINAAGQMPDLPAGAFVETAARADRTGVHPERLDLPTAIRPLVQRTAAVTDMVVRAARERRAGLVLAAVEMDPTITDKAAGRAAIAECLRAHADVLGPFA